MSDPRKTAIIADDHAFTVSGMREVLEKDGLLQVMGTAENGIMAIALIKQHRPDCAILDHSMPGATGLEVMFEGRRWSPDTRFVVITGNLSRGPINELLAADVDGLFAKTTDPQEIKAGIAEVLRGQQHRCAKIQRVADDSRSSNSLTVRELEVLSGIARGLSNPLISEHLGVSVKTVDSHRTSLMRKLGVRSTAALLVRSMKDGLIDLSDVG